MLTLFSCILTLLFPDYCALLCSTHGLLNNYVKMDERAFRVKAVKSGRNAHIKFGNDTKFKLQEKPQDFDPLTTKNAIKFLLEGTLKFRVCRYCLCIASQLSEPDEIFEVARRGAIYKVTLRDMIACVHPFKATEDPNFPDKICQKCVESAISSYIFSQQCERSERALRNCFDDMYDKFEKLDPIERNKKRGRQKANPNPNLLYTEHEKVIDYAEPIINIINIGTVSKQTGQEISDLECPKCWQVLPDVMSLLNHEKIHPKSMWYSCRLCGESFVKIHLYKRHIKTSHSKDIVPDTKDQSIRCIECGTSSSGYSQHMLHMEKHKFKTTFEHLINRNMERLCSVCLEKKTCMVPMNEIIHLHGGYPGLNNETMIYSVVTSTFPEITKHDYTGTHICETCLDRALTTYVFISKIRHVRTRLYTCVSVMLDQLRGVNDCDKNIMVEIANNTILPAIKEEKVFEADDDVDESKLEVDFLEDEFRIKSSSSSEEESESDSERKSEASEVKSDVFSFVGDTQNDSKSPVQEVEEMYNPAKKVTKTYMNKKLLNGYQSLMVEDESLNDVCEFLTFRKKRKIRRVYKCKYTCPYCNKHFISDYFLKKHILKHTTAKVNCKTCGMQFKSKFLLYEHVKMIHLMKETCYNTCNVCGRMFNNKQKFKKHEKCHRMKECQLCDKFFISQKHFDFHMQRHTIKLSMMKNWKVQTCSFCEKECANENELSLHVNKIHLQIKPYNCDMCDKLFYTEYDLKNHKKLHNLYSEEMCEFCDKTFICRKHLVIHVRKHLGTKPHVCQVCRQAFYSEYRMKRHMIVYHGGRFCCRLCKTVSATKSELRTHISIEHNAM